jgi:hypothetical protein
MTTNQERDDRRAIFSAITATGVVEVRNLSVMTDEWYATWRTVAAGRNRFASRDRQLESFIAGKVATLREISTGRLLNHSQRFA